MQGHTSPKGLVRSPSLGRFLFVHVQASGVHARAALTVCVLLLPGICPVNRDTIDYLLSKNGSGNAVIIVVGGAAESLSSRPGKNAVTLRNRKGFVKLALRHG